MTTLGAMRDPREYITVDNCSDILTCIYCGQYSEPHKFDRRGQCVCVNFENCVYNRLEDGRISEARAGQLLGRKV
jgi:hypothetical protein